MKRFLIAAVLFISGVCPLVSSAEDIRLFVSEFSVSGAANRDELKGMLPGLLASRISSDRIIVVDSPNDAGLTVIGSYTAIGKMFSLDLVVKETSGGVIVRTFEQGDSPDDLIPAVGRVARKLSADLEKRTALPPTVPVAKASTQPLPQQIKPSGSVSTVIPVQSGDIIRAEPIPAAGASGWVSQRLVGAMVGVAPGKSLPGGDREVFVAHERGVQLYSLGKELKLIAEKAFTGDQKVLAIDTADLDNNGTPELYVTLASGTSLTSQVLAVEGGTFIIRAEKLPYYFRSISLKGGTKKLYAQQISVDSDYFGDVYELIHQGSGFDLKNPLKMPRFATIFNFNLIQDKDGKDCFVVLHPDGYLLVYDTKGEELWRSNDKYGGSETYFVREAPEALRVTGERIRKLFLEQRLTVTRSGEVLAPQNGGFWVVGDSRSYSKNSIYSFAWSGASLDERWHTKPSQNYLADYFFDEERKELILLEVVKKSGLMEKGASAILVKKIE